MTTWSANDYAATVLCVVLVLILGRDWIKHEWKQIKEWWRK